ncbi:DoxX family protein [Hymenobacter cellulosivorans]|uniref:DoxX family protein n=1 Tax=Hymenobacter cellulosivorans TaxID=2932249 RepID=A0ABY4FB63_9BACT|nr:DoxX family protein [Hymenobacter cellulosivorans]UOQ51686.1 DoxX family protein [Hymenobacter cellulosivorans]
MPLNKKALLTGLVTAVPALMIIASGIMKLTGAEEVRQGLTAAHMVEYMPVLGLMELIFTALFIYPKTMKLGLLLLTSYFAGAIAVDLSHAHTAVPAAVILSLVWIAAFVRDRSAFLPVSEAAV